MLTFFNEHAHSIDTVAAAFTRRGLGRIVTPHGVPPTSLERVHTPRYLHFLRSASAAAADAPSLVPARWPAAGQRRDVEPDDLSARLGLYATDTTTLLSPGTWTAAKTGADCAINAAHALRLGQHGTFALTLPAGHHAGAESFGGGCFLNNAALAAQHLLDDGLARVAILDIAGRHGSGTQAIFYARRDVLTVSIHLDPRGSYPFYSGHADETGVGDGLGFNMNLPLAPGSGATAWLAALETACLKMSAYAPQALVVALGADASFQLGGGDGLRIGERLGYLGLPAVFVYEGGFGDNAAAAPEGNVINVLEGFETAA